MRSIDSTATVTDLFTGCGGSTTGAIQGGADVRLAINHSERAIETHNTNYPDVQHVLTDISRTDPRRYRRTRILLASPECTNHSLAKGQRRKNLGNAELWGTLEYNPEEERSRCLMWDPLRFAEVHEYDLCIIENVVDARHWIMWDAWMKAWDLLDYDTEIVYLNSMFAHPTPQSRDRMYVVCWKKKNKKPDLTFMPTAWCRRCGKNVESVQCWKNPLFVWGRYERQYDYRCPSCNDKVTPYYYAAANAINWSKKTERIGDRKRPLEPKTMNRIKIGLEKYTSRNPFLLNMTYSHTASSMEMPMPTQTTRLETAVVEPFVFSMNHEKLQSAGLLTEPTPTRTTFDDMGVVFPWPFMIDHLGTQEGYRDRHIMRWMSTLCASGNHQSVVIPPYLLDLHGTSTTHHITDPLAGISAGGSHHALIEPPSESWIMTYYNNGQMAETREAMPTATTKDRHALITTEQLPCAVEDCGFRMLDPSEIKAGMAFPSDYIITGNRKEQVQQLGNAVTPPVMKRLMDRCIASLA